MAGRLISIQGKQTFTFNNAASQSTVVYLGERAYEIVDTVSGVLHVRVSAMSLPAGASITIQLYNVMIMPDDPSTIYMPNPVSYIVGASISATDTGQPRLYLSTFGSGGSPVSAMFACNMNVTYGATPGVGSITLAVDVLVRDGR